MGSSKADRLLLIYFVQLNSFLTADEGSQADIIYTDFSKVFIVWTTVYCLINSAVSDS